VDKFKLRLGIMYFMVLGAMLVGGMVGNYAARRRFESMSIAQAQQAQIDQATKAAQEAQAHAARLANQAQSASEGKKDTFKELEKLGSLKQQGVLTEEEFQKMKARLLSNI
jgi:putative oligomerization/nucleic acid binding protein